MTLLSGAYGRVTQWRREWYAHRPERRRRLDHPVVSVGNLIAGGSGKTPTVIAIARLLLARGERPVVLTRGYGRCEPIDGVLVVSDGARVLEPVARSGDEPQLIARALPGVPVLVTADRYAAGAFAERTFRPTLSILDDGFQHVQLERDVDLLMVSSADLAERVLPSGLLREPLGAARLADALLVTGSDDDVATVSRVLGRETAFKVTTRYADLKGPRRTSVPDTADAARRTGVPDTADATRRTGAPDDSHTAQSPDAARTFQVRVIAFAGIARPRRFFDALRACGYDVAAELTFRDHHWFTAGDLARIQQAAREQQASLVVTTEKDAVRLPSVTWDVPLATLPMAVDIEPADAFESWLTERLAAARTTCPPKPRSSEGG